MKLVFEVNAAFEKDLKRLDPKDIHRIVYKINTYCSLLQKQPALFFKYAKRPLMPYLAKGLKSSMYTLRIDKDVRVILTVDEDPLFNQIIVTLIRVVRHNDLNKTFGSIAESLYQKNLIKLKPI